MVYSLVFSIMLIIQKLKKIYIKRDNKYTKHIPTTLIENTFAKLFQQNRRTELIELCVKIHIKTN
jgi:hypothetical protein